MGFNGGKNAHFVNGVDLLRITDKWHLAITSVPVTQVSLLNGEIARKYNESSNSLRQLILESRNIKTNAPVVKTTRSKLRLIKMIANGRPVRIWIIFVLSESLDGFICLLVFCLGISISYFDKKHSVKNHKWQFTIFGAKILLHKLNDKSLHHLGIPFVRFNILNCFWYECSCNSIKSFSL